MGASAFSMSGTQSRFNEVEVQELEPRAIGNEVQGLKLARGL